MIGLRYNLLLINLFHLTVLLDIFEQTFFVRQLEVILEMVMHAEPGDRDLPLSFALVTCLPVVGRISVDSLSVDGTRLALGAGRLAENTDFGGLLPVTELRPNDVRLVPIAYYL